MRPDCRPAPLTTYCPFGVTAYLSVYNSVRGESYGLIHGRLHDAKGHHCAVGSYFSSVNHDAALPTEVLNEIATINDSCESFTPKQRKTAVLRYLRWKLDSMGYKIPGKQPRKKQ